MVSRELYINGRLCDLPTGYSPRINRQLINPSELAMKDAQYSYSITLPPTTRNNEALDYVGVEEVGNKFNRRFAAELIINGIRIFKGYFKLTEVSENGYKGNLYKPDSKTSKELFPSEKWSDMKGYFMDFSDFISSVNKYNNAAASVPQAAIFPYVLYGLLPKRPDANGYGARNEWDGRVGLTHDDIPPSLNVLRVIKEAFKLKGYTLTGDALLDEHLQKIYVSYKNDPNYEQPWNYLRGGYVKMSGSWYSSRMDNGRPAFFENVITHSSISDFVLSAAVSNGTNTSIASLDDPGKIVSNGVITVPYSGYYKISMRIDIRTRRSGNNEEGRDTDTGILHIQSGELDQRCIDIRLMRNRVGIGDLPNLQLDGSYYRDNLSQQENSPVKYFPPVIEDTCYLMVDEVQDDSLVAGVSFGKSLRRTIYNNPLDTRNTQAAILVKSPFLSWSEEGLVAAEDRRFSLAPAPGYTKLGEGSTDKYKIPLSNVPFSFAKALTSHNPGSVSSTSFGNAMVNVISRLKKGDKLTLASIVEGVNLNTTGGEFRMPVHSCDFSIELTPFRADSDWIPLSYLENGTLPVLDWEDEPTFEKDRIDLFKFMPVNDKVSDFIDNVCKAFNLHLTDLGGNAFSLDKSALNVENNYVNLDKISSVTKRVNQSLDMPSDFLVSFTVNDKEEGFYVDGDKGVSGKLLTGAIYGKTVEQRNAFSYNWFKRIKKDGSYIMLPVISEHKVWTEEAGYSEAMKEVYTNLAQRFWFYDGTFEATVNDKVVSLAKVTNSSGAELSYSNAPNSLLNLCFFTLVSADSHYTELEGYPTPDQYEALDGRKKAIFNGDVYYVADISGYDPSGRNKTKIKLIKNI